MKNSIKRFFWRFRFSWVMTFLEYLGIGIVAIAISFGITLLLAFPVKWLWNWLMPEIFELVKITFWQSWGLLMLSGLIIKSSSSSSSKKSSKD